MGNAAQSDGGGGSMNPRLLALLAGGPSGGGQQFRNSFTDMLDKASGKIPGNSPEGNGVFGPYGASGNNGNGVNTGSMFGPPIYNAQGQATVMGQVVPDVWSHIGANANAPDPYEQLQQQLLAQLNGIRVDATPIEALRAQAEAAANREYDPQISALNAEISGTKDRAAHGQQESRDMYGALATDLVNQLPEITNRFKQAEDATSARYDQAQQQMQQGYQQQQAQQQSILDQLGISAAMGDPRLQQASNDQQYFANQNQLSKNQAIDALSQMQNTDTSYQNKVAGNTRLAGENRAQDIGRDLETYLQGANAKMGSLNSSKASAIEQLLGQLQQADSARQQSASQNAFQQIMAMNNFGLDLLKTKNQSTQSNNDLMLKLMQMQNQAGGNQIGLGAAENYLAKAYPNDTSTATALEGLLQQVLMSPEVMSGRQTVTDPSTGGPSNAPITDEYVMNKLRQLAQQNKIGGGDINNLIDAYLQYKKR